MNNDFILRWGPTFLGLVAGALVLVIIIAVAPYVQKIRDYRRAKVKKDKTPSQDLHNPVDDCKAGKHQFNEMGSCFDCGTTQDAPTTLHPSSQMKKK